MFCVWWVYCNDDLDSDYYQDNLENNGRGRSSLRARTGSRNAIKVVVNGNKQHTELTKQAEAGAIFRGSSLVTGLPARVENEVFCTILEPTDWVWCMPPGLMAACVLRRYVKFSSLWSLGVTFSWCSPASIASISDLMISHGDLRESISCCLNHSSIWWKSGSFNGINRKASFRGCFNCKCARSRTKLFRAR